MCELKSWVEENTCLLSSVFLSFYFHTIVLLTVWALFKWMFDIHEWTHIPHANFPASHTDWAVVKQSTDPVSLDARQRRSLIGCHCTSVGLIGQECKREKGEEF